MQLMTNHIKIGLLPLAFLACSLGWAQDRFDSGELKGFTIGRGEHIINHLDVTLTVREVKGSAVIADGFKTPAGGMLLELRGPQDSSSVVSTITKGDGKFHLRHVHPGTYLFKATLLGFQSVVGTIIVSPTVATNQVITIEMKPGV